MYQIEFTQQARDDLRGFTKRQHNEILDAIETQLRHEPAIETRNRKLLRDNVTARWELRIGSIRVFYNVDQVVQIVSVRAIGEKRGNRIFFRGEEGEL